MNKSESITELAKALNSFQGKMVAVKKDATNPFYKSKYATLDTIWETIRRLLSENGLSVTQTMGMLEGNPPMTLLETTLCHTSGEWISGTQIVNPVKNDPQSLGSAISYARRYSLSAILGLVADEDDDVNRATKSEVKHSTGSKLPSDNVQGTTGLGKEQTSIVAPTEEEQPAKPKRDPATIKTIGDLRSALLKDFGIRSDQQLKELNLKDWDFLTLTPVEAYQQVASTRAI